MEVTNLLIAQLNKVNAVADADPDSKSPAMLGRIRVPNTSEIVADHFRAQIVSGELAEGAFLPPKAG